jgi:hypothetical protein
MPSISSRTLLDGPLNFEKYLDFHKSFMGVLLLQLTLSCPLECRHCIVRSGPTRRERLDAVDVERAIRSFSMLTQSKLVCLTGGEPFSHRSALKKSLAVCQECNLYSYVITSANWASSVSAARKVLMDVGPIDLISISVDHFHDEFLNPENVIHAISASQDAGIPINILYTHDKNFPSRGEDLRRSLESRSLQVEIIETPLGRVGRAQDLGIGEIIEEMELMNDPCPIFGSVAVTASGNMSACCQVNETNIIENSKDHALFVGSICNTDFSKIRDKFDHSMLFKAIRYLGPRWVYEFAVEQSLLVRDASSEITMCRICSNVVRNLPIVSELEERLGEGYAFYMISHAEAINEPN